MSIETPPGTRSPSGPAASSYEDAHGSGWIMFAVILMFVIGTMNIISGIAAIDNANFYINDAQFVISNLDTWGWVILITGVVQILAAFGIAARNQFARWLGVGFVSLNALAQLLILPAYPLLSLALFAIDILVIYGLVAYGQHAPRT